MAQRAVSPADARARVGRLLIEWRIRTHAFPRCIVLSADLRYALATDGLDPVTAAGRRTLFGLPFEVSPSCPDVWFGEDPAP